MKKKLIVGATTLGVIALASTGIAVNAATLSVLPTSKIGQAPSLLVPAPSATALDDKGGLRPDDVADDATGTPSPWPEAETDDDSLPRSSGQDDGPDHDVDDDNLPRHSGLDDGPEHDLGDDNPDESHSGRDDDRDSDDRHSDDDSDDSDDSGKDDDSDDHDHDHGDD